MDLKPKEVVLPKTEESCSICKTSRKLRYFSTDYTYKGKTENFVQMFTSCFHMKLVDPSGTGGMCGSCVLRLRSAMAFRRQVEAVGQALVQYLEQPAVVEIEIANWVDKIPAIDIPDTSSVDFDSTLTDYYSQFDTFLDEELSVNNVLTHRKELKKENTKEHMNKVTKEQVKEITKEEAKEIPKEQVKEIHKKEAKEIPKEYMKEIYKERLKDIPKKQIKVNHIEQTTDIPTEHMNELIKEEINEIIVEQEEIPKEQKERIKEHEENAPFEEVDWRLRECLPWSDEEEPVQDDTKSKRIEWKDQPQLFRRLKLSIPREKIKNPCFVCNATITTKSRTSLENHIKSHFPRYLCDICGRLFVPKFDLLTHIGRHSGGENLPCADCSRTFVHARGLRLHRQENHTKKLMFACTKCDERFHSRFARKDHLMEKHGVWYDQFPCPHCQKKQYSPFRLNAHVRRIHLKEKTAPCPQCSYVAFNPYTLKVHMRSHKDSKDFKCAKCGKCYKTKKILKIHSCHPHGQLREKHKCTVCGDAFPLASALKNHQLSDHKDITAI